jgi:hypothetical protein
MTKWSASRSGRFTPRVRDFNAHRTGNWIGLRRRLYAAQKRKISAPPEIKSRSSPTYFTDWAVPCGVCIYIYIYLFMYVCTDTNTAELTRICENQLSEILSCHLVSSNTYRCHGHILLYKTLSGKRNQSILQTPVIALYRMKIVLSLYSWAMLHQIRWSSCYYTYTPCFMSDPDTHWRIHSAVASNTKLGQNQPSDSRVVNWRTTKITFV